MFLDVNLVLTRW